MDLQKFWFSSGAAGGGGEQIGNSLRFRGAQVLTRTFTETTPETCTFSVWIKRAELGTSQIIFNCATASNNFERLIFNPTDTFSVYAQAAGNDVENVRTSALWRDPSAWYHLVYVKDTPNATASNRIRIYVNGTEITDLEASTYPAQDGGLGLINTNFTHMIGRDADTAVSFFDGYMAEIYFVDGQALQPTSFGTRNDNGIWVPVAYDGDADDYGANGFYLNFSDPDDIGADSAPVDANMAHSSANDWTPNGFELTNDDEWEYDSMTDSPTQNWATLNPLVRFYGATGPGTEGNVSSPTADGNLSLNGTAGAQKYGLSTIATRGRSYVELTFGDTASGGSTLTFQINDGTPPENQLFYGNSEWYGFASDGNVIQGNGTTSTTTLVSNLSPTWSSGDVIMMALDMDNGRAYFGRNGTWLGNANPAAGTGANITGLNADIAWIGESTGSAPDNPTINYGQQPFQHGPPNGFEAVQTDNMPTPTILDGSDHFRALTGTGANILAIAQGTNTTGTNWNPDVNTGFTDGLWWIKDMANSNVHQFVDSVTNAALTGNQASRSPRPDNSAGSGWAAYGAPSGNSVAWCWNLINDNSNGFDIVRYEGNGTDNRTVDHDLGANPEFIITGCRQLNNLTSTSVPMCVFFVNPETAANNRLLLGSNGSATTPVGSTTGGVGAVSTTNVTLRGSSGMDGVNTNNLFYTMYLWRSVPGYSAFGSYEGNGNNNGPFIYTGFRPAFVLQKSVNRTGGWQLTDSTRNPNNPANERLFPNSTQAETETTPVDLLSNGFKIRDNASTQNEDGRIYFYAAFAENPFGGENTAPANAR